MSLQPRMRRKSTLTEPSRCGRIAHFAEAAVRGSWLTGSCGGQPEHIGVHVDGDSATGCPQECGQFARAPCAHRARVVADPATGVTSLSCCPDVAAARDGV